MFSIHSEEYKEIINRLIKARKSANPTQKDVAERLNKPQSFISKIETCQRRLDILELKALVELYGVDIGEILEE